MKRSRLRTIFFLSHPNFQSRVSRLVHLINSRVVFPPVVSRKSKEIFISPHHGISNASYVRSLFLLLSSTSHRAPPQSLDLRHTTPHNLHLLPSNHRHLLFCFARPRSPTYLARGPLRGAPLLQPLLRYPQVSATDLLRASI